MRAERLGGLAVSRVKIIEIAQFAAKAKIVRAFYDAADRLLEERAHNGPDSAPVTLARSNLEDLIAQSAGAESRDLEKPLHTVAEAYFSRINGAEKIDIKS